jgi:dephospho-CoA kinase
MFSPLTDRLNRRALRERIFGDSTARTTQRHPASTHPHHVARAAQATREGSYALLVIPLLTENRDQYAWVDRVLVVDVPRDVQRARLVARDGITPELADAMLDAQATRAQRLVIADDVIENVGTLDDIGRSVSALHERYLAFAAQNHEPLISSNSSVNRSRQLRGEEGNRHRQEAHRPRS